MRTTWQPLSNETKRDASTGSPRFFVLWKIIMKTKPLTFLLALTKKSVCTTCVQYK